MRNSSSSTRITVLVSNILDASIVGRIHRQQVKSLAFTGPLLVQLRR